MIKWVGWLIVLLSLAGIGHIAIVLATPYYLADSAWERLSRYNKINKFTLDDLASDAFPLFSDPTFITGYCPFSLDNNSLRISIPHSDYYWSITVYDKLARVVWNSDNVGYSKPYIIAFSYLKPSLLTRLLGISFTTLNNPENIAARPPKSFQDEDIQSGGSAILKNTLAEPATINYKTLPTKQGIVAVKMFVPSAVYHRIIAKKAQLVTCNLSD